LRESLQGFTGEMASNDNFGRYTYWTDKAKNYCTVTRSPTVIFHWSQNRWPWTAIWLCYNEMHCWCAVLLFVFWTNGYVSFSATILLRVQSIKSDVIKPNMWHTQKMAT